MPELTAVPSQEILRFRGDSAALTIPLYHPDTGAAYDPTASGPLLFTIKASADDLDSAAIVQKLSNAGAMTLANPTVVTLVADDAALISAQKTYLFDVLDTATNRTVAQGTFWTEQRLSLTGALAIATNVIDPAAPYLDAATIAANAAAAEAWAHKTDGIVEATDYSAKEFAQGTQPATGGSAKNWAAQTGADVTGAATNDRSAKSWAQEAIPGATLGGSAKDWAQSDSKPDGVNESAKTYAALASTNGAAQVTLATAQVALATTQAGNAAASAASAAAVGLSVVNPNLNARASADYLQSDGATSNRRIENKYGALGAVAGSDLTWVGGPTIVPTSISAFQVQFAAVCGSNSADAPGQANSLMVYIAAASSDLYIRENGATTGDRCLFRYIGFRTDYSGKLVRLVVAFSGGSTTNPTVWCDGVDISSNFSLLTAGTPPNWVDASTLTTYFLEGYTWPAGPFRPGRFINRKFAQADVDFVQATGKLSFADANGGSMVSQSSGTLTIGARYRITNYVSADSFTNVGAGSNATGVEFVATGTTPTTWSNSSTLIPLGAFSDPVIQRCQVLDDATPNGMAAIMVGFTPVTPKKEWRVPALVDMSSTGNKQLLSGAFFNDPTSQALDSIDTVCTGTPTFSIGDGTTATKYTASVAHSAGNTRETLSTNYPADSAKTGIYANVTVTGGTAEKIVIRGHRK